MRDERAIGGITQHFYLEVVPYQGLLVLFSFRMRKVGKCLNCMPSLGVFSLVKQR